MSSLAVNMGLRAFEPLGHKLHLPTVIQTYYKLPVIVAFTLDFYHCLCSSLNHCAACTLRTWTVCGPVCLGRTLEVPDLISSELQRT